MLRTVIIFIFFALSIKSANTQINTPYNEGFDDIAALTDWTFVNNSDIPDIDMFQGNPAVFISNSGADNSYIGANFRSTSGSIISNWAISPELSFCQGATLTYYTRTVAGNTFTDGSELRISINGSSVDVGITPTSVGDFIIQAIDLNTALVTGGYPDTWTQFTYTYSGPPVTGRAALRYVVSSDAGPGGSNSNFIGFDDFEYTPGQCVAVPTMGEWGLIALALILMIFGVVAIPNRSVNLKLG